MKTCFLFLATSLVFAAPLHPQDDYRSVQRNACMDACMRERPNADLQRQEVIALEKEMARAIQLGDATFFRRVYSDDFSGVLSHGQSVDKSGMIAAVQSRDVSYYSFTASDIKVRLYRDLAVSTALWSMRAVFNGQRLDTQMRVLHIFMYTGGGYRVISTQTTLLPPFLQQPL